MNTALPIRDVMVRAARSLREAKTSVSANHIHEMAQFAATAHDALAFIRLAAEAAHQQGGAINPESLLAFLADNQLMLQPLEDQIHEQSAA